MYFVRPDIYIYIYIDSRETKQELSRNNIKPYYFTHITCSWTQKIFDDTLNELKKKKNYYKIKTQ